MYICGWVIVNTRWGGGYEEKELKRDALCSYVCVIEDPHIAGLPTLINGVCDVNIESRTLLARQLLCEIGMWCHARQCRCLIITSVM